MDEQKKPYHYRKRKSGRTSQGKIYADHQGACGIFQHWVSAVETEDGLISAVQKIYQIIDDIVLEKEASQFKTDLQIGTKYYRARVIDLIDDNSLEKGIGKTLDGKFSGYNDVNLREPVLGISGEGRNIWNEHGSAFFRN